MGWRVLGTNCLFCLGGSGEGRIDSLSMGVLSTDLSVPPLPRSRCLLDVWWS